MVFSQHILIRIQPSLRDGARVAADRAGLSVAEFVRRAIQRELVEPAAADRPSSTDLDQSDLCPVQRPAMGASQAMPFAQMKRER